MLNNLTNFFNLIKGKMIKTQLEDSDLIAIGTKQSPALGDYKPTAIQYKDLKASLSACPTYESKVYTDYPFPILPTVIKGCTSVTETVGEGMFIPKDTVFDTYKVGGALSVSGPNIDTQYIGTIELEPVSGFSFFLGWKISGIVTIFDNILGIEIHSAFANGCSVQDSNTGTSIPAELMTFMVFSEDGLSYDLFISYAASTAVGDIVANLSFEYEFLTEQGTGVNFVIY